MSAAEAPSPIAVSDQRLAARIAEIRGQQLERLRKRAGTTIPTHVISEERLIAIAHDLREEELLRVLDHPAYPAVGRRLAALGCDLGNDLIDKAQRDFSRFVAGLWALYLHATPGGLTHSRLTALWELSATGARNHAYAMLAYLRFLDYVRPEPAADGRERRYRPTDRMVAAFRGYFRDQLLAISPLDPGLEDLARHLDEPGQFDRFIATLGEGLAAATLLLRPAAPPPFNMYSRRRSGLVMLWTLLHSADDGEHWPPRAAFAASVNDLAKRAGVSRMHAQRLLTDSVAAGMLSLEPDGRYQARSLLRREVRTFQAIAVLSLGHCARDALYRS